MVDIHEPLRTKQPEPMEMKTAFHKSLFREFARTQGYEGRKGGWIYTEDGTPVVQGWMSLYMEVARLREQYRDWLAREACGLGSFSAIVTSNHYRPTIRPRSKYHRALADEYDAVMARKGMEKRAFRGQHHG